MNRKLDFPAFKSALTFLALSKYPDMPSSGTHPLNNCLKPYFVGCLRLVQGLVVKPSAPVVVQMRTCG